MAGPAIDPGQQLGGGNIEVAPAADHAVAPLGGLGGGVFQHLLLVAVGHGAHFGGGAPVGDHFQNRLETHHQIGGFQGGPAAQGEHPGVAGADGDDGHCYVGGVVHCDKSVKENPPALRLPGAETLVGSGGAASGVAAGRGWHRLR